MGLYMGLDYRFKVWNGWVSGLGYGIPAFRLSDVASTALETYPARRGPLSAEKENVD